MQSPSLHCSSRDRRLPPLQECHWCALELPQTQPALASFSPLACFWALSIYKAGFHISVKFTSYEATRKSAKLALISCRPIVYTTKSCTFINWFFNSSHPQQVYPREVSWELLLSICSSPFPGEVFCWVIGWWKMDISSGRSLYIAWWRGGEFK